MRGYALKRLFIVESRHSRTEEVESRVLMQKFVPVTPMTLMTMMASGPSAMSSLEMIRISSC